jgi:serine/threonine protein kinase
MATQSFAGQLLGQYQLLEFLGAGGMGAVYRAQQTSLKRIVAVKILTPSLISQPGSIERFNREAETAASLEHGNIVPIYDYGIQRDISYVVMRLLTGGSLADRLRRRAFEEQSLPTLRDTANLLIALGSALDHAHSRGVIHRDIKPANVMFDDRGTPYLVDFGIAKLLNATSGLTSTGAAIGSPAYMPPEQWLNAPVTSASDEYALAASAYELVTGQLPFNAATPYALMVMHLHDAPTPVQTLRPNASHALQNVFARALAKAPEDRYPTCSEFAEEFQAAVEPVSSEPRNTFFMAPTQARSRITTQKSLNITNPLSVATQTHTAVNPLYRRPTFLGISFVGLLLFLGIVGLGASKLTGNDSPAQTQTSAAFQHQQELFHGTMTAFAITSPTPTASPTASQTPSLTSTVTATTTGSVTATPTATKASQQSDTIGVNAKQTLSAGATFAAINTQVARSQINAAQTQTIALTATAAQAAINSANAAQAQSQAMTATAIQAAINSANAAQAQSIAMTATAIQVQLNAIAQAQMLTQQAAQAQTQVAATQIWRINATATAQARLQQTALALTAAAIPTTVPAPVGTDIPPQVIFEMDGCSSVAIHGTVSVKLANTVRANIVISSDLSKSIASQTVPLNGSTYDMVVAYPPQPFGTTLIVSVGQWDGSKYVRPANIASGRCK